MIRTRLSFSALSPHLCSAKGSQSLEFSEWYISSQGVMSSNVFSTNFELWDDLNSYTMSDTGMNDTAAVGEPSCSLVVEIFTLVFYPLVMIVGLPGNCLILRVYWAKRLKSSTAVLIMGLAWADLFSCLFMVFRAGSSCLLIDLQPRREYDRCTDFLLFTAIASSLMITSVIAFDRYDCVCRPQRRFFNRKRAIVAVVSCVFYSATINFPGIVQVFAPSPLTGIITLVFQVLCFVSALFMVIICYRKVYITIRKHVNNGNIFHQKVAKSKESSTKSHAFMTSVVAGVQNNTQNISKNVEVENTLDNSAIKSIAAKSTFIKHAWQNPAHELSTELSTENQGNLADSSRLNDKFLKESITLAATNADMHASTSTSAKPIFTVNPAPALSEMAQRAPSHMGPADSAEKPSSVPQRPVTSLQRRTTRMLLITSVVFLISWMPRWAYVALLIADQLPTVVVRRDVMIAVGLSSLLEFINHAVNPIIYGLANRRFRKDCNVEMQKLRCW